MRREVTASAAIISILIAPSAHCFEKSFNVEGGDLKPLPNVGFLLYGYNVFKGNPQSTQAGVDPGFTSATVIYQAMYSGQTTTDGRYEVPDNTNIVSNYGCALSFTSKVMFKKADYQKSLEVDVEAHFEGFGASFSSSVDYTSFEEYTSSERVKMVSSMAECVVYTGGIDAYGPPDFTNNFKRGMNQLPIEYGSGEQYFDFIDTFGTHTVKQVTMGARFGFTSFLDEQASNKIEKTGVSIEVAAGYDGIVKVGGNFTDKSSQEAQKAFSAASQHQGLITLGTKPTTTDSTRWAQSVIEEPMPIRYKLVKICDVFENATKKANCNRALTPAEYCEKRLVVPGQLQSCDAPRDSDLACLWDSDCGQGEQCSNHRCERKPVRAEIHSTDIVYLKHVASEKYFKDVRAADTRKGWPHGALGSPRGEFKLLFETPTFPIKVAGDTLLRVQSLTSTATGYDFMYESVAGGIYFDVNDEEDNKQWWKLTKVLQGADDDDILRDNDIVRFENIYYPGNFLQEYEDDWVYSLPGKDNWVIQLSQEATRLSSLLV